MAWSLPYTGKRSVIKDSYQRVALTTPFSEINSSSFVNDVLGITKGNILHIHIVNIPQFKKNNMETVIEKFATLSNLKRLVQSNNSIVGGINNSSTANVLYLSIQVSHKDTHLLQFLISCELRIDLIIVNVDGDKNDTLNVVINLRKSLDSFLENSPGVPVTSLGIGNIIDATELDWLQSKIPQSYIHMVHLGDVLLPNMRTHCIEVAHAAGHNTFVTFPQEAIAQCTSPSQATENYCFSSSLAELAKPYNVAPDAFVLKCFLQLGCVVGVPYIPGASASSEGAYGASSAVVSATSSDNKQPVSVSATAAAINDRYSRLAHPFVHRKPFVSAFRVFSLQIRSADLAVLVAASEAHEALADDVWKPFATSRAEPRVLRYS
jgi:hypothetical protein